MTEESKFKLEYIIDQTINEAYEIGYQDGLESGDARASMAFDRAAQALAAEMHKLRKRNRYGKWIEITTRNDMIRRFICDQCVFETPDVSFNYCPKCGIPMEVRKNE